MRCTLIIVNGIPVPRKIGTGKSASECSAYLATARAYLHFPPLACHLLLATSVPFCFFDEFDSANWRSGQKNKTTARVSAGLRATTGPVQPPQTRRTIQRLSALPSLSALLRSPLAGRWWRPQGPAEQTVQVGKVSSSSKLLWSF